MFSYRPQDYAPLVAPARPSAALWRVMLGTIVVIVVMTLASQLVFGAVLALGGQDQLRALAQGESPLATLVLLLSLGGLTLGTWVALRLLHRRGLAGLIGPPGLALRQSGRVALAMVILNGGLLLLFLWGLDAAPAPNLPLGRWLMLLPLALTALLVQTASEEIFFRGYLQSQLAARFSTPLIWLVVPAILFAAGHFAAGTYGGNALAVALWAGVFGLVAGDLTARSGTLGPAITLHFFNNLVVLVLVSMEGMLSGLSLFTLPFGPDDEAALAGALPLDFLSLGVSWLAARLALRR